ncbi:sensor histidine kinase [Amycolatopsis minnesotensis]|uniref:sensor histidine kinase n=1 Tax=Amycolatopsis minnesotensis TaxID=337894 RepID=UPI0031DCE0B2
MSTQAAAYAPGAVLRRVLTEPARGRFWRELGWLLSSTPLSIVSAVLVLAGTAVGMATSPLFIGLLVLAGVLQLAREFGRAHRALAGRLLGVTATAPPRRPLEPGLWNWIRARVGDGPGWRAFAYLLLRLPVALVELFFTGSFLLYAIAAILYPLLWQAMDGQAMPVFDIRSEHWASSLGYAATGVLVLFATPWLVHGILALDRVLVRALIGRATLAEQLRALFGGAELSERVRDLEVSRAVAVEDTTVKLRRIERDLHDGAQAQLVAVAMKLGSAKDALAESDVDLDQLRALVSSAHAGAKHALVELRDLARGIHPPALDAGLGVALSTLASSAGGGVVVETEIDRRPPPSVETILYFTAAELLTNATKHGGLPARIAVTSPDGLLRLTVHDEGDGGAAVVPGGGLAGLADRVRTVDGTLRIDSPEGGPTVITVDIPLRR